MKTQKGKSNKTENEIKLCQQAKNNFLKQAWNYKISPTIYWIFMSKKIISARELMVITYILNNKMEVTVTMLHKNTGYAYESLYTVLSRLMAMNIMIPNFDTNNQTFAVNPDLNVLQTTIDMKLDAKEIKEQMKKIKAHLSKKDVKKAKALVRKNIDKKVAIKKSKELELSDELLQKIKGK